MRPYTDRMPVLGPGSPLPTRPFRVLVAGASGSGKTTLAARIAEVTGGPHTEIDSLFHGPGWTPRPTFVEDVLAFTAAPAWTTEWQYGQVRPLLLERADLLVWLDLPKPRVAWQVSRRTVLRRLRRTHLWNGNIEPPLHAFLTDPQHVVRYALTMYPKNRLMVMHAAQDRPDLPVVRLSSHAEARAWLAGPLASAVRA